MRVVDLDGNASVWKIKGHIVKNNDSRPRSKHHLKARALLKEMFPTCQLIEEVSIAPRKGEVLYLDFYIPLHSLCVEVHGEQHYKFIPHYHGNMMGLYIRQNMNLRISYMIKHGNLHLLRVYKRNKKKTSIGHSTQTKHKQPGTHGGNRGYKKRYRGQGK